MFPTLDLLKAGYEVHVPTDACGDVTPEAHERAVDRLVQAGAVPMNALQVVFATISRSSSPTSTATNRRWS